MSRSMPMGASHFASNYADIGTQHELSSYAPKRANPTERRGRKVTGLKSERLYDGGIAGFPRRVERLHKSSHCHHLRTLAATVGPVSITLSTRPKESRTNTPVDSERFYAHGSDGRNVDYRRAFDDDGAIAHDS